MNNKNTGARALRALEHAQRTPDIMRAIARMARIMRAIERVVLPCRPVADTEKIGSASIFDVL